MSDVGQPVTVSQPAVVSSLHEWRKVRNTARSWRPPCQPTTVVVPHPDDEALLFGGLIGSLLERSIPVDVIAVTDGEAAYEPGLSDALADRRRREQRESFDVLGLDEGRVRRLGLPDGRVYEHLDLLTAAIVELANPVVVAPWTHDHHCDHEASGWAARRAAAVLDADVYGGLFWAWYRTPAARLDGGRMVRLRLDPSGRDRRVRALGRHHTQLEHIYGPPVLTSDLLEPVGWRWEYYVVDRVSSRTSAGTHAS